MAIKCLHSQHTGSESQTKAKKSDPDEQNPIEEKAGTEELKAYNLDFIKHDWFEKGKDLLTIHVYVRQVNSDLLDVGLFENELRIKFATSHEDFLKIYPGSTPNTIFSWNVKLRGLIDVTQCSFKTLKYMLEITLRKKTPGRWGSLEQPNIAGLTPVTNGKAKEFIKLKPDSPPNGITNGTNAGPSGPVREEKKIFGTPPSSSVNSNQESTITKDSDLNCNGLSPLSNDDTSSESSQSTLDSIPLPPPPPPMKLPCSEDSNKLGVMGGSRSQGSELSFSEAIRSAAESGVSAVKDAPQEKLAIQSGFTGLDNLGNTCYLNSIIQCLANTRKLRDFFLDGDYKADINSDNPLGFGGKLALVFANLIKNMWSGKSKHIPPQQLKNIIGDKICQFRGFMQQDAQEFMAFLLDGLHEDLNRVLKKPYTEEVEGAGKPDHVVANEAWKRHKSRNDSVIVDLFQGQLKSKLTCPACGTISIKYDPFMNLSVPLPKEQKLLKVAVFFKDPSRMPVKIIVKVSQDGGLDQLTSAVERKTGIRTQNMRVFEEFQGKFHKFFKRGSSLSQSTITDNIFVFEVLSVEEAEEEVYEIPVIQRLSYPAKIPGHCADCYRNQNPNEPLKRCTRCYAIGYCNRKCQEKHWATHKRTCKKTGRHAIGLPFIVSMPASQSTFTRLKDLAEEYARHSVDVRDGEPNPDKSDTDREFSSSHETSAVSSCEVSPDTHPRFFFKPISECGESLMGPEGARLTDQGDQPLDLTDRILAIDWRNIPRMPDYVMVSNKQLECEEHVSCETEELATSYSCSLQECIELFTEPETLGEDDAWHCPKCKKHRQATKQLSVWQLPETLIIHLKRFSFKNIMYRDKITKVVEFPVRGLDMSPFSLDKSRTGQDVYDLYAVANHMGTVNFGHYTAFGRLPPTSTPSPVSGDEKEAIEWRYFDDRSVTVTPEERVVSKYAYVLFYQRRGSTALQTTHAPGHRIKQSSAKTSPQASNDSIGSPSREHAQNTRTASVTQPVTRAGTKAQMKQQKISNGVHSTTERISPMQTLPRDVTSSSTSPTSRNLADVDECELD